MQTVLVAVLQVCTHLKSDFGSLIFTESFGSLHGLSIASRSGNCPGHSIILMCFFFSRYFVTFTVYFKSLASWKTHSQPPRLGWHSSFYSFKYPLHDPDQEWLPCWKPVVNMAVNAPKNIRQTFKLGVLAVTHKLCWGDNLTENGRQQNNCKKNNSSKLVGFNQQLL